MEVFNKLGSEIEDLWRAANYDEAALPTIAADALRGHDIPSRTNVWEVAEWALAMPELPRQRDVHSKFGDPPITIYSGPRFHVDVYFWFEGTTAIHQHSFCGAFQVMHGSSIHSWYSFEREKKINAFAEIGSISLKTCELLNVGDVQEIQAGKEYIHSLFHLDHPSTTIVVRTDRSPLELPQYSYHKPGLAVDPFFEQETVTKKTQLAAALIRAKNPDADRLIGKWLGECDFQTTFNMLANLRNLLRSNRIDKLFNLVEPADRLQQFIDLAEKRHGRDVDVLRAVFDRQDMIDEIVGRRNFVTEPELRFFLALLMNVDGRERIFSLVKQRFPDADPLDKVLDWTFELSTTRLVGSDKGGNALGIQDFGDADLFILEQMLLGNTGSAIEDALKSQFGESAGEAVKAAAEKEARIRDAAIFRYLFT